MSIAIEGASFITAYPRQGRRDAGGRIGAGSRLDEKTARVLALREGIRYVLAGGYRAA